MINPFPWLSSLWFEKGWTVFHTQTILWLTSTYHEPSFYFSHFSRSTIKKWKDLFTVWRAAARRWRCKRQAAPRCLVSCLPFLNLFCVNFIETLLMRVRHSFLFVYCRLQLGSTTGSWSFKWTFLRAKTFPLKLCKYSLHTKKIVDFYSKS